MVSTNNTIVLPPHTQVDDVYVSTPAASVPPVLGFAMKNLYPGITPDALKYWWRMQATAYIMRINGQTMSKLKELRMGADVLSQGDVSELDKIKQSRTPFPLPEGSFSMHVRHGDKGKEMRLIPFEDYVFKAEQFISQNPMRYRKIAFVSTEDASVTEEADRLSKQPFMELSSKARTTRDKQWTFQWDSIPRKL